MGLEDKGGKKKTGRKPGQRRRRALEVARDKKEITRLRLMYRYTPEQIADYLNTNYYSTPGETAHVSSKQVEAELTELTKKAKDEALKDVLDLRAVSIRECEVMEAFCLDQFYKTESAKTRRKIKKKSVKLNLGTEKAPDYRPATITDAEIERIHRDGSSAWIELLFKFRNKRYELLNIDPPKKIAPTNPAGDKPFEFTGSEEMRRLMPLFEKFLKAKGEK